MNDGNLLVFGCAVSFIALAGAYVFMRERFLFARRRLQEVEEPRRKLREVA